MKVSISFLIHIYMVGYDETFEGLQTSLGSKLVTKKQSRIRAQGLQW